MVDKLFKEWDLETWANVLEVIGFIITIVSLGVALFVKSELKKLKDGYIFDKRVNQHIRALDKSASNLNTLFDDYNNSHDLIKKELRICISELSDLASKLDFRQNMKIRLFIFFISRRLSKPFEDKTEKKSMILEFLNKYLKRIYTTTYEDNSLIYTKIYEVIRRVENIKKNNDKSLKQ